MEEFKIQKKPKLKAPKPPKVNKKMVPSTKYYKKRLRELRRKFK